MRSEITFRALLRQRIGALNPLQAKLLEPVHIEVFKASRGKWLSRSLRARGDELVPNGPLPIIAMPGPDSAMHAVNAVFEKVLIDWKPVRDGQEIELEPRNPDEEPRPKVHTHYSHAGADTKRGGYFNTACGMLVHYSMILTTRSETPPSCPKCAGMREEILQSYGQPHAAKA